MRRTDERQGPGVASRYPLGLRVAGVPMAVASADRISIGSAGARDESEKRGSTLDGRVKHPGWSNRADRSQRTVVLPVPDMILHLSRVVP
jgi:hypothetical protein